MYAAEIVITVNHHETQNNFETLEMNSVTVSTGYPFPLLRCMQFCCRLQPHRMSGSDLLHPTQSVVAVWTRSRRPSADAVVGCWYTVGELCFTLASTGFRSEWYVVCAPCKQDQRHQPFFPDMDGVIGGEMMLHLRGTAGAGARARKRF